MKKRWDIEVRFLNGPLANHQIYTYQGPQINIGSNPGVGGMEIRRPMISPVHARIDCFAKGQVTIHPIEYAEVRVATHAHEDWTKMDPLYKPVPLMDGNVIYIGPLGHGIIFVFERVKTFDWQAEQMSSLVEQNNQIDVSLSQNTKAKTIRVSKYPVWFFPTLIGMVSVTMAVLLVKVMNIFAPEPPLFGRTMDGYYHHVVIDVNAPVEASLLEGFKGPFADFVMRENEDASGIEGIFSNDTLWDQKLYEMVVKTIKRTGSSNAFWKQLDEIQEEYAYVVTVLREADLPEVFAGVPYQETRYRRNEVSPVCAGGIWQFMPETGKRVGLNMKQCQLKDGGSWEPKAISPPSPIKNAEYVDHNASEGKNSCKIIKCGVDERVDVEESTKAAVKLLNESFSDKDLRESGSVVQASILAHNAGLDDREYIGKIKWVNVYPAYQRYIQSAAFKKKKRRNGVHFYGDNICPQTVKGQDGEANKCQSELWEETQHYGYRAIAYHILAVCYYANHYPNEPAFKDWTKYAEGYCKKLPVPPVEGK